MSILLDPTINQANYSVPAKFPHGNKETLQTTATQTLGLDKIHPHFPSRDDLKDRKVKVLDEDPLIPEERDGLLQGEQDPLSEILQNELAPLDSSEKQTVVELALAQSYADLEQELNKGEEADQEKLYILALSVIYLQMIRAGRTDQLFATQKAKELEEHVKKMQGTYNNPFEIFFQALSAAGSLAAGFCGISGLPGIKTLFTAETVVTLSNASTPLSTLAQALNFSKPFSEKDMAKRTGFQHDKESAQTKQSSLGEDKQRKRGSADNLHHIAQSALDAIHRAISATLGG